jgi:hypothetical protein
MKTKLLQLLILTAGAVGNLLHAQLTNVDDHSVASLGEMHLTQLPQPSLISVDFGSDGDMSAPEIGPAAIGLSSADVWNFYSRDNGSGGYRANGTLQNLRQSDGAATSVDLAVQNAAGAWFTEVPDNMFRSYLYPLSRTGNITITFTELSHNEYDVYVYAHGLPNGENAVVSVASGKISYGSQTTSSQPGWDSVIWTEGKQYVVFRNVAIGDDGSVAVTSGPGVSRLAVINGIQILSSGPLRPRRAAAAAELVNGFVVNLRITDSGNGYTEAPVVLILGDGQDAAATATITDGVLTGLTITNAGRGYTTPPQVVIASPAVDVHLDIRVSRIAVDLSVALGKKYVLESSNDLKTWTPTGDPFIAQSETLTKEFVVGETGQFFRLKPVP